MARGEAVPSGAPERASWAHDLSNFALIFTAIFVAHATLLRLPYFWDEAGYFIPAAWDLYRTGDLIPHTTLSNAHPPLVMIWLAFWWKFSNFAPAATRTVMLLASASGLLALYKLGKFVANARVAVAATALTALYPVVFAQSSMAQLDIGVFSVMTWSIYFHVTQRHRMSILFQALSCIAKETAVVTPLTLCAWDLASSYLWHARPELAERWCLPRRKPWKAFAHLLALLPLGCWYAYHFHRTGHVFGNPEFVRYNVAATITPLRVGIAFLMRLWHEFGYMNMFVLTGLALLALRIPPLAEPLPIDPSSPPPSRCNRPTGQRMGIEPRFQMVFLLLILGHAVEFSVLGGALLARYMVPVIGLWILMAVAILYRRLREWAVWCLIAGVAFVFALNFNPPWRIAPEDNLAYADFVRLHTEASAYITRHYDGRPVLTAWPASDELNHPFLGYVTQPVTVIRVENFTAEQMLAAARQRENYDVVLAFSTKYDPPRSLMNRLEWWNRLQERYFDYHRDLGPAEIATIVQGRIAWQRQRGGEWAAIIELDKARNAQLSIEPYPRSAHPSSP